MKKNQNIQGIVSKKGKIKIGGSFAAQDNLIQTSIASKNIQGIVADDEVSIGNFSFLDNRIESIAGLENIQGIETENDIEVKELFQFERNEITENVIKEESKSIINNNNYITYRATHGGFINVGEINVEGEGNLINMVGSKQAENKIEETEKELATNIEQPTNK